MSVLRHTNPKLPAVRLGHLHDKPTIVDGLLRFRIVGNKIAKPVFKNCSDAILSNIVSHLPSETKYSLLLKLVNGQSISSFKTSAGIVYSIDLINKTKG